jgi:alkaline phosphatase D
MRRGSWSFRACPCRFRLARQAPPGGDGWANYQQTSGFEIELLDILRYMQQNGIYNVLWITTDVHFSEVFQYTPFADAPEFQVHEVVTGPLNAGVFPNAAFDTTLNTVSLFRHPLTAPANYEGAKRSFNFGLARIDEHGWLTTSVNDLTGAPLYELTLSPR